MAAEKEGNAECREPCSSAHFASDHRQPPIRFTMFTTADYYYHCAFFSTFCLRARICVFTSIIIRLAYRTTNVHFFKENTQREKEKESYHSVTFCVSIRSTRETIIIIFERKKKKKRKRILSIRKVDVSLETYIADLKNNLFYRAIFHRRLNARGDLTRAASGRRALVLTLA